MRTNILTIENIKTFLLEIFFNKTSKVTKVSDNSILNGVFYSQSKLFQKGMKDSALVESELFPEFAYGQDLDLSSKRQGIGPRYGALSSSTYIRVVGEPGTSYSFEQNIFISSSGLQFKASEDWTIPSEGFCYVRIRSLLQGSSTITAPYSINRLLAPPVGHKYCLNDVLASGGRDIESDDIFRSRIQKRFDMFSTGTLSKLTQIMIEINPNILKIKKLGKTSAGLTKLGLITQTGASLTEQELSTLLDKAKDYLSLTDFKLINGKYTGVQLTNIDFTEINIDFRVDLYPGTDLAEFSTQIQTRIASYLDWRFWDETSKVEWDTLFFIIKSQSQVRYIPDQYFQPRADIVIGVNSLPRLTSFLVRNPSGDLIIDSSNFIKPVFYENYLDLNFSTTVISNL